MKARKIALVSMLACIAALCFALVGCGGGSDNKANFVGDWTLESMGDSTMTITADDLSTLGLSVTMTVKEDGTGKLSMMDEPIDFTWEAKSATEMTMKSPDTSASTLTLADGKLSGDYDDTKIVFKKKQ